jgi:Cu2+-containing amine oxidase
MTTITAERVYNENETTREYGNRIYSGVVGWRWHPSINGRQVGDVDGYRTKREAIAAATKEAVAA